MFPLKLLKIDSCILKVATDSSERVMVMDSVQ